MINVPTGRSQRNHAAVCSDLAVTPHQTEMDVEANEGKFFKRTTKKSWGLIRPPEGKRQPQQMADEKSGSPGAALTQTNDAPLNSAANRQRYPDPIEPNVNGLKKKTTAAGMVVGNRIRLKSG